MVTSEERRAQMKAYYQANKERLAEYRAANKERTAAYFKQYRADNKEKAAAYDKKYRADNKEQRAAKAAAYKKANREKITAYSKVYSKAYSKANPGKMNAITAKRHAAKMQRTPNWLTKEDYHAIRTLYETAAALTKATGINHHVDHIIPLQGRTVSGFHCPNNLQILTQFENCSKNNKFTGEH